MKSLLVLSLVFLSLQSVSYGSETKEEILLKALSNTTLIGNNTNSCKLDFKLAQVLSSESSLLSGSDITIATNNKFFNENKYGSHKLYNAVLKVIGEPVFTESNPSTPNLLEAMVVVTTPELADADANRKNTGSVEYLFITLDEQSNIVSITAKTHNIYLNGKTDLLEKFKCN